MAFALSGLFNFFAGASANGFIYSTADTINTVKSASAYNYFGTAHNNFKVGDFIIFVPSGATSPAFLGVSAVATGVVTANATQ